MYIATYDGETLHIAYGVDGQLIQDAYVDPQDAMCATEIKAENTQLRARVEEQTAWLINQDKQIEALEAERERLKAHHARERETRLRYGKALSRIACYFEGDEVDASFDEPYAAECARAALEAE
jgi:hypothetical protein